MSNNLVDEIRSRCNIVDVIGKYVQLKKAGNNYKGLCPFHHEKTPSFMVSEEKQIFTCFGCGETGNVVGFIMKIENMEFLDAAKKLCKDYNIDIKDRRFTAESSKDEYYEINKAAARYYYKCFMGAPNPGFDYMIKRGIDVPTLKKFGIGYSDGEWASLYDHLIQLGFKKEQMSKIGIVQESKGKVYDKFRNRVMFPIINTSGNVIGFGGRVLDDGMPKYLNSNESVVFTKKNNLYGLNLARQDINKNNYVILVEGYMDVISLYRAGIKNVVASLGTALTENQALMLKRYTENIILSYDADDAGQKATQRGIDMLYAAGCRPKVLRITDGKDPDEFIKTNGKTAYLSLVDKAMPFVDYKISVLRDKYDIGSTQGSLDFYNSVSGVLAGISPVEADVYIKQIASETGISEGALRMQVRGDGRSQVRHAPLGDRREYREAQEGQADGFQRKNDIQKADSLQKNLLKLMIVNKEYIPEIEKYENVFESETCYRIYRTIKNIYHTGKDYDYNLISDGLDGIDRAFVETIMKNIHFEGTEELVFRDCIKTIRRRSLRDREKEILQMFSILNFEEDKEQLEILTRELREIRSEIHRQI